MERGSSKVARQVYQLHKTSWQFTLILSVSIGVLAMSILAFSTRFGWLTPTFLSRRNPASIQW